MEGAEPPQQLTILGSGDFRLPGDPGIELGVGKLDQPLVVVQVPLAQLGDMGVGESTHDQVHLAIAAMPGSKEDPAPSRIEPIA